MDAQTEAKVAGQENEPIKKTLMLDTNTVEWGEELAEMDHRGCLSNVVKWLVEREYNARKKEGEVAA